MKIYPYTLYSSYISSLSLLKLCVFYAENNGEILDLGQFPIMYDFVLLKLLMSVLYRIISKYEW